MFSTIPVNTTIFFNGDSSPRLRKKFNGTSGFSA